jgi:predicted dehydrogenase
MAPGGIAIRFVESLLKHTRHQVVAVGSRSAERAREFAGRFGIERAYGSYEQLAEDPGVDAVYVAAPNSEHRRLALLAIAGGKHALVEKPFTDTAAEAREIADAGRAAGVVVMEAMWTRYLPQSDVIRQLLAAGALGEVRFVAADHGQKLPTDSRLYKPELGGGALLDLGVYPVAFAFSILGRPASVVAHGSLTANGLDAQSVVSLGYPSGAQAAVTTTMLARTPTGAVVAGTEALLEGKGPFYAPSTFTLSLPPTATGPSITWQDETGIVGGEGLCYQAAALARYAGEGRTESPLLPLDESIAIMGVLEEARHQVGAYLPGETRP